MSEYRPLEWQETKNVGWCDNSQYRAGSVRISEWRGECCTFRIFPIVRRNVIAWMICHAESENQFHATLADAKAACEARNKRWHDEQAAASHDAGEVRP